MSFVFRKDLFAEILFEILAYYKHNLAESGVYGIIDRVVHDCFSVGAEAVELLEAAITASHAGCKNE